MSDIAQQFLTNVGRGIRGIGGTLWGIAGAVALGITAEVTYSYCYEFERKGGTTSVTILLQIANEPKLVYPPADPRPEVTFSPIVNTPGFADPLAMFSPYQGPTVGPTEPRLNSYVVTLTARSGETLIVNPRPQISGFGYIFGPTDLPTLLVP